MRLCAAGKQVARPGTLKVVAWGEAALGGSMGKQPLLRLAHQHLYLSKTPQRILRAPPSLETLKAH